MISYFAFSDEAGNYEPCCNRKFLKSHPFYVRATVLISAEDYLKYQNAIKELNKSVNLPKYEEIKWSDVWSKAHNKTRSRYIQSIDIVALKDYYRNALSQAVRLDSVKYIITVTKNGRNYDSKLKMMGFHMQEALQRVHYDMNDEKVNGFATFVIDELPSDCSQQIKRKCYSLITDEDKNKLSTLYTGILYEQSNTSAGLQLADYIAGICNSIFKSMNAKSNNYLFAKELFADFVFPRIRRSDTGEIMGFGVREVRKNNDFRKQLNNTFMKYRIDETNK